MEITDLTKENPCFIAQKYIETPLIMKNRKFDLRQWVLVTSWNPLTVWLYREPYVRFPAADFTLDQLGNNFAHLSNNSVAKKGQTQTAHHIEGNMWSLAQFQAWLAEEYGGCDGDDADVWGQEIAPKIKQLVLKSLESAQDALFEQQDSRRG